MWAAKLVRGKPVPKRPPPPRYPPTGQESIGFPQVMRGLAASILRIIRAFPGFVIIGATPSLLSFPVDTALNKKKYYNRRTHRQDGWNGGWLRKQQTPETCPIFAGDLQDNRRKLRGNGRRRVSPADYQPVMPGCFGTGLRQPLAPCSVGGWLWITCG